MFDTDMIEVKVTDDDFSTYLKSQSADSWTWSKDGKTCTFFAECRIVARTHNVGADRVIKVPRSYFTNMPRGALVNVAA